MRRLTLLLLCLAFFSLACLSEAAAISDQPVAASATAPSAEVATNEARALDTESPAGAVYWPGVTNAGLIQESCARVIASDALNVRAGASENDIVLTWLSHNEIVVVVDRTDSDWWYIESGIYSGYVRASYLVESECS